MQVLKFRFAQILLNMSWEACEEFRPTTQNHNWILTGWMSLSQTVLQALQILLDELFLRLGVSDVSCKWNRDGYLISRSILPVLWIRKFHFTLCKLIFALKYFVAHWLHNVICKCLCICAFTLLYQMMKFSDSWCKVIIVRSVITELASKYPMKRFSR